MHPTPNPPDQQDQSNDPSRLALQRLLAQMPPEIAQSFNEPQLAAMQSALIASTRKRHPIDIRWSIPVLMRRFYLVLLMGEEARSRARRQTE